MMRRRETKHEWRFGTGGAGGTCVRSGFRGMAWSGTLVWYAGLVRWPNTHPLLAFAVLLLALFSWSPDPFVARAAVLARCSGTLGRHAGPARCSRHLVSHPSFAALC